MSYTTLYRKFRPRDFKDVKGQDHIVTTLRNQLEAGRVGHAYLFCGTRGTGKTTVAKIFAKAVNCESPTEDGPCGKCVSCRAVAAGASMNVIEIDAASNNGVENIREIREEVAYRPTEGNYKVYIIDEVHMLSIGAFNALLKTLEEPPEYVIFILATTEAHKIPVTILSRCQRHDFKRISVDVICSRLQELLKLEGAMAEEAALRYIAKAADGAMRDALSLLDQCMAFYMGQKLTYEKVLDVLGAADEEVFRTLFLQVSAQDVPGALETVERLVADGRELSQFVMDFTWHLRNLLLLHGSEDASAAIDLSAEALGRLRKDAAEASLETLIRHIRIFSELSNQMRHSSQKRVLLEVALIKLCSPQMEQDYLSLAKRVEQLEEKLAQGAIVAAPQEARAAVAEPARKNEPPKRIEAIPGDVEEAVKRWGEIASSLPGLSRNYLNKAKKTLGERGELVLEFEDSMAAGYFSGEEERRQLEEAVARRIGGSVPILIREAEAGRSFEEPNVDLDQVIHMEITYED